MESEGVQVVCDQTFSEDPDLQKVYQAILKACEEITLHIRYSTSNKITTANDFGDVQLDFDVQIDSILFDALKDCVDMQVVIEKKDGYAKVNQ